MIFIFWQNILSIHQVSFLRNLSKNNEVVLIVENSLDERRINDGWNIPDFGSCEIVINPDKEKINSFFEIQNAIHIFSGINAYPLTKLGFKLAIQKNVKIGIISEPFNWLGFKGKLRFLRYFIYRFLYDKHIIFICAVGNRGRWCFEKTGFRKNKIFDWGYFTETAEIDISSNKDLDKKNVLFIGNIDKRKNILRLIDSCIKNKEYLSEITIIGKGPLKDELVDKIKDYPFMNYVGSVINKEIKHYIVCSNLLVLPSIFDGWGAVVNESLLCGTPVLVSDRCGSSVLINGIRGKIFSVKKNNLDNVLQSFLKDLPYDYKKRKIIQQWSQENISGKAASTYFLKIIDFVFHNAKVKPVAPWLQNK